MKTFWLKFAIEEAIGVAEVFIQASAIPAPLKMSLEKLITDGQIIINAL